MISIETEPLRPDEIAEIGPRRFGILPSLVLRPAVERSFAPTRRLALAAIRPHRRPTAVVGIDFGCEISLPIAIPNERGDEGKARGDLAALRRPADAEAGYGDTSLRKRQQVADGVRVVADGADRTAAEAEHRRRADEGRERDRRVHDGV